MKTRLLSAAVAAVLAAGTGLAQSPSLPPIAPIPILPEATSTSGDPPTQVPLKEPAAAAPVAPAPQIAPGTAAMPGPPEMPAAEVPCTACEAGFLDRHTGPRDCFWVRPEYGYLWFAAAKVPVLAQNAATGAILLGGRDQNFNGVSAGYVSFGFWMNDRHTVGLYAGGMMTDKRTVVTAIASDAAGVPGIRRPFVNALTGLDDSLLVAGTQGNTLATGSLASNVSARIDGVDTGTVWNILHCDNRSVNFLFGVRYVDLDEQLTVDQATQFVRGGPIYAAPHPAAAVGALTGLQVNDRFRTRNQFFAAQFGLDGEWCVGPVFVGLTPKVAFGTNRQTTDVDGFTTFAGPNGPGQVTVPGGLYAVGIPGGAAGTQGVYGKDVVNRFSVLTDITGKVGVQLTAHVRLTAGYNFLYLSNVARPGLEIQPVINPRVIPASQAFGTTSGPDAPQRAYDRTDYVAHGVIFGLDVRW